MRCGYAFSTAETAIVQKRHLSRRRNFAPLVAGLHVYTGLSIPIFLIRDASVVGLIPNISAAPPSPESFHLVCCNAATRFARSRRRISSSVTISICSGLTCLPLRPRADSTRLSADQNEACLQPT